jgi:colanic acid biosynthesis glycosyl transferase WcaI
MGRLIFINRFFHPDHSATSQLVSDLASHLAQSGWEVHVITSRQIYDNPKASLPVTEIAIGAHVHRVFSTRFGRVNLLGRGIDYLSFYISVWRQVLALARSGDIVIAKTDPPLLSILAQRAARRRGAHLVNWLQDLFPEIAIRLGVPLVDGRFGRALIALRDRSLKAARANVVVGAQMGERLSAQGIRPQVIHVIPNWTDDGTIRPVPNEANTLRRQWKLEGKFVVGYCGNLGRAHEFETILAAAKRLRGRPHVVFVFIGGGYQIDELSRRVKDDGLQSSFRFFPYQARELLGYALSVPDVHWISLKPELEGLIVPSKFYGISAAGRPTIAITAGDGEVARLVAEHNCGVVIEPGDADALADVIIQLALDRPRLEAMGIRARNMLDAKFARRLALQRWQALLEDIAQLQGDGPTMRAARSKAAIW